MSRIRESLTPEAPHKPPVLGGWVAEGKHLHPHPVLSLSTPEYLLQVGTLQPTSASSKRLFFNTKTAASALTEPQSLRVGLAFQDVPEEMPFLCEHLASA